MSIKEPIFVTKEEFLEWMNHPITELLELNIKDMIFDLKEGLAVEAGINVRDDALAVGKIHAYTDILDWEPSFSNVEKELT